MAAVGASQTCATGHLQNASLKDVPHQDVITSSQAHATVRSLAPEIIDNIVAVLDDQDAKALRVGHSLFHDSVSRKIFHTIVIRPNRSNPRWLDELVSASSGLHTYVQHIEFNMRVNDWEMANLPHWSSKVADFAPGVPAPFVYGFAKFAHAMPKLFNVQSASITFDASGLRFYGDEPHPADLLAQVSAHISRLPQMPRKLQVYTETDGFDSDTLTTDTIHLRDLIEDPFLLYLQQTNPTVRSDFSRLECLELSLINCLQARYPLQSGQLRGALKSMKGSLQVLRLAFYTDNDSSARGFTSCVSCRGDVQERFSYESLFGTSEYPHLRELSTHNVNHSGLGDFVKCNDASLKCVVVSQYRCDRRIIDYFTMRRLACTVGSALERIIFTHQAVADTRPCSWQAVENGEEDPGANRAWVIRASNLLAAYEHGRMSENEILHAIAYEQTVPLETAYITQEDAELFSQTGVQFAKPCVYTWVGDSLNPDSFFSGDVLGEHFQADVQRGKVRTAVFERYCDLYNDVCVHDSTLPYFRPCSGKQHDSWIHEQLYAFVVNDRSGIYRLQTRSEGVKLVEFKFDHYLSRDTSHPAADEFWHETPNAQIIMRHMSRWENGAVLSYGNVDSTGCQRIDWEPRIDDAFVDQMFFYESRPAPWWMWDEDLAVGELLAVS